MSPLTPALLRTEITAARLPLSGPELAEDLICSPALHCHVVMAKNVTAAVAMVLAALMVLQARPTNADAEIMSSTIQDLPSGLELRRELSVRMFLAREDKHRCVTEMRRNHGYYFVPVEDGEPGVTFDRCELGEEGNAMARHATAASGFTQTPDP
jgi:hypothetical protein